MVAKGEKISKAITSTVKYAAVTGVLSFAGAKTAKLATRAYGAAKAVQMAKKRIEKSSQIIKVAKITGKVIAFTVRGVVSAIRKVAK